MTKGGNRNKARRPPFPNMYDIAFIGRRSLVDHNLIAENDVDVRPAILRSYSPASRAFLCPQRLKS